MPSPLSFRRRPASGAALHPLDGQPLHCHIVPTTDPDVGQMIEFRDLFRRDPAARLAYAADERRIAAQTRDSRGDALWAVRVGASRCTRGTAG